MPNTQYFRKFVFASFVPEQSFFCGKIEAKFRPKASANPRDSPKVGLLNFRCGAVDQVVLGRRKRTTVS
jgi:hypothetical protein